MNYTVIKRNYGHWDIVSQQARMFRIRGNPGAYLVMDERAKPYPSTPFKTITGCMAFIADELMHEDIIPGSCGNNEPRQPA